MRTGSTSAARTRALAAAALALVLVGARAWAAKDPPQRRVGLHWASGWLGVSVGLDDLFGPRDTERLRSGFVVRIDIRVELFKDGASKAIARRDRHSEILFDLWDERFQVRVVESGGPVEKVVATGKEAIEVATGLKRFQVAELTALEPNARYRMRVRADLNPLSADLVADVRKWLVKTPGQGRSPAGDSVFGSFVSFFVNPRIEESERQIVFLSQPFSGSGP